MTNELGCANEVSFIRYNRSANAWDIWSRWSDGMEYDRTVE